MINNSNNFKPTSNVKEPICPGCQDGLEIANSAALNYLLNLLGSCSRGDKFRINYGFYMGDGNALHNFCYKMMLPQKPGTDYNPNKVYAPDVPPYYIGKSPSFASDWKEIEKIIITLVTKVNSLKETDSFFQQSPLYAAIAYDNTPSALALIKIIAEDPTLSNELFNMLSEDETYGTTPLFLSIQRANLQVFTALIDTGLIDVNIKGKFGLSPLHWAVIMGLPEMVVALLEAGANPNAETDAGKTPFDYINISKHQLCDSGEFRPVMAHFWERTALFLEIRNEKMKTAQEKIYSLILKTPLKQKRPLPLISNLEHRQRNITPQFNNNANTQSINVPEITIEQQLTNNCKSFFDVSDTQAQKLAGLLISTNGNKSLDDHINQLHDLFSLADFDVNKLVHNLEERLRNKQKLTGLL